MLVFQAAKRLGVTGAHVRRLISNGHLVACPLENGYLNVDEASVVRYEQERLRIGENLTVRPGKAVKRDEALAALAAR